MTDLSHLRGLIERVLPITANETPDYAELSFGDHQTQAMTMDPATWLEIGEALPALLDEIERLREAVGKAQHKFAHYADLHRLKCTAEGDEKADRNQELADAMSLALTPNKEPDHG